MTFSLTANPSSDSWHRVPGRSSKYLEDFMSDNDNRKLIQPPLEIQIHGLAAFVTVHKFMCPIHSEAEQMEMSEFWAKKPLLQGHIRRTGGLCSKKIPNSLEGFSKAFSKARWGRGIQGCVICLQQKLFTFYVVLQDMQMRNIKQLVHCPFLHFAYKGKCLCPAHIDLSPFSQQFLRHAAFL